MKQKSILIVDDSAYARRILRHTLETAGYRVSEAANGMGGIEAYAVERPDLVLLDLTMEDMGGVDVLKKIKEIDAEACVIIVSADVQDTTADIVRGAGATAFLGKPATPETLLAAVEDVLNR